MFRSLAICLSFFVLATGAWANDLDLAPENFAQSGSQAVFIDITTCDIDLVLDVRARTAAAQVVLSFHQPEQGYPVFDLIPSVSELFVNGQKADASLFTAVSTPDGETTFRIVKQVLPPGQHTVEVRYNLGSTNLAWESQGVRLGLFMSDLSRRRFLEQYFPTNMEYDQYQTDMNVEVVNAGYSHRLMTNGALQELGTNKFRVEFPDYFTASSYFFHLIDPRDYAIRSENYQGTEKVIPIIVYAQSSSLANSGMSGLKRYMAELEGTYGPFSHPNYVAYITSGGGGMEYCGATVSSLGALAHELTHSWFARGVMPNSGNSGWMDEAIASWRDRGYPQSNGLPNRPPVNLAGFSQYRRNTSYDSYSKGMTFISELDYVFRLDGGMRKQLKEYFAQHKLTPVDTPIFHEYMQKKAGKNLLDRFDRYVYGKGEDLQVGEEHHDHDHKHADDDYVSPCQKGYTEEELREIL